MLFQKCRENHRFLDMDAQNSHPEKKCDRNSDDCPGRSAVPICGCLTSNHAIFFQTGLNRPLSFSLAYSFAGASSSGPLFRGELTALPTGHVSTSPADAG